VLLDHFHYFCIRDFLAKLGECILDRLEVQTASVVDVEAVKNSVNLVISQELVQVDCAHDELCVVDFAVFIIV